MSAIHYDHGPFAVVRQSFSFFEQPQIEIPAPIKYQQAQEEREWLLRDKGPDWYLWNALTAHHFYLMKKTEWWRTFV